MCERGAFDIYHDLEACLEAHKHMERVVSTKMPFQYLHAVNFLLFVFVFGAPFVFTTGFKWLSPVPSCIVAVAFYGVAEVARSIEDPYSWSSRATTSPAWDGACTSSRSSCTRRASRTRTREARS